ncbi:hypothetical protein AIOL_004274 [Candidatus Rhodobacter oscarellae]|uniref:Uncharacterized protein n=1 Tax=Candidatus Rhodobacter oscarellae TaxID=1675527 RepID=A0A0J9H0N0_9RHOB|nr:hypothetical protein AIOL_004274 [Candidatus Rhodobacter lobularis]
MRLVTLKLFLCHIVGRLTFKGPVAARVIIARSLAARPGKIKQMLPKPV